MVRVRLDRRKYFYVLYPCTNTSGVLSQWSSAWYSIKLTMSLSFTDTFCALRQYIQRYKNSKAKIPGRRRPLNRSLINLVPRNVEHASGPLGTQPHLNHFVDYLPDWWLAMVPDLSGSSRRLKKMQEILWMNVFRYITKYVWTDIALIYLKYRMSKRSFMNFI